MTGLSAFTIADGSVCFTGEVCQERMTRNEEKRPGTWPWNGPVMQGDCRAAVAWPEDRDTGQVIVGVLDPEGLLRVITMVPFEKVATGVDPSGKMVQGLGVIMRELVMFGIKQIAVQADNSVQANDWWRLIGMDQSTGGIRIPADPVTELDTAIRVWKEVKHLIVVPQEYLVAMQTANAVGKITPAMRAVAMLAMSYKMVKRFRVKPMDKRWDNWN